MSRFKKTFAPRAGRSETQIDDNKEDEKKYEQITDQDSKVSLAKTEVTQIAYAPFKNRAFNKIEKGSSRIQFLNSGLHVLALNKALNALGHKVSENEASFGDTTKIALINFQKQNGITGSGIFDKETLLKMDEVLEKSQIDKEANLDKNEKISFKEKEEKIPTQNTLSDRTVRLSVGIVPMNIKSNQEFFDFLDIKIFGVITDINWDIDEKSYKDYIGKETHCNVYISLLKKYLGITDEQWEDMQSKTTASTSSAVELRESVGKYLEKSKARETAIENRSILETKLYGLKEFYNEYIMYTDYLNSAISYQNSNTPNLSPLFTIPNWQEELNKKAKKYGFKDLTDFENTINEYLDSFRGETINLVQDYIHKYEHLLYEEEIRLKKGDTIKQLYTTFYNTGAAKNINEGKIKESNALTMMNGLAFDKLYKEGEKEKKAGVDKVKTLDSSLFKDKTFNFDKLAAANSQKEFEEVLFDFIRSKQKNAHKVRQDLKDNPDAVYKQQELLQYSYQKQGVVKDSILDLIIQQRIKSIEWTETLKNVGLAIAAIIAITVTWGAATPYVIAGTAVSLGISAYNVYEALDEYYKKDAAYEIGLLKDKPNFIWVIVAIAGAALDAASLAAVFRAAKPITEAAELFNNSAKSAEDILTLKTSLAKIEGLSDKVRTNIVKQAELTVEFRNTAQEFLRAASTLNTGINYSVLPQLVRLARLSIIRGITTFEKFLLELKVNKIINSVDNLTDEELKVLKDAFTDAKKGHTYPDFDEKSVNFNRFRDRKMHRTEIANAKPGIYLKHKKAKTVEQAISFSKNGGDAQYLPYVNINALEKTALQKGEVFIPKNNKNVTYFFYKSNRVIGYDNGIPTEWIRAEISSGFHHSHPINTDRLSKYIKL
ncbi:hypothetical protein DBR39_11655 [Chryseobacterium sp. KBW03]|uniref:peptidoglycan-binding domain-containing protein n=1 Tax=Chryseobacterium sp. KBW03 TaxID=2153362 RepID=UPI000F59D762|nr:peptidoglycan-binding domain-containing protein [Chryseobacterium sp. KBW03]RQO37544.1 hypothetical protein DBR39_11655 [Chryseobacterium sp. KBW03]